MHIRARIIGLTAVGLALVSFAMAQAPATPAPGGQAAGRRRPRRPSLARMARGSESTRPPSPSRTVMASSSAGAIRIPRSSGSSVSTLPRSADSSTTSRTTSPSAPRRGPSPRGRSPRRTEVELLRSPTLDPYGRTLAYLFINGRNFSVLAIKAGYSGRDGQPLRRQRTAPRVRRGHWPPLRPSAPPSFEPPHLYRARMRTLTNWLKETGRYPKN